MSLWWLSFVDGSRPEGDRFVGVCVVEADEFIDAIRLSHELGCNPGGAVRGTPTKDIPLTKRGILFRGVAAVESAFGEVVLPSVAAKSAPIHPLPATTDRGAIPRKPSKPKGPRESVVQRDVMQWLATMRHVFAERQNSGAMPMEHKGKKRFIRFSRPGAPDIRCCIRGRYVAVEVKREGGVQSESQVAWQAEFELAGGLYLVVRSLDDARLAFEKAGLT